MSVDPVLFHAIQVEARSEFNLCPMCWTPLYLDQTNPVDLSWEMVQIVFKGKPAFSIEADGYKHERPVLVFGVSRLHSGAKSTATVRTVTTFTSLCLQAILDLKIHGIGTLV